MMSFENKVVVVTGAASGIGLAIATAMLREGARVAMIDLDVDALADAVAGMTCDPGQVGAFACDVVDRQELEKVAKEIEAEFGCVDILCNNAGIAIGASIERCTYEMWDWALGINLGGVINGMQTFLPLILAHGRGGHIVNTASVLAHMAAPGQAIYCASKYAVLGLSEAARRDLEPHNIGVSILSPGLIATNIVKQLAERPSEYGGGAGQSSELIDVHQMYQEKGLSTEVVAAQVLEGIRENRPHIFTDQEQLTLIRDRQGLIVTSIENVQTTGAERA